jgi:hypothetical protein
MYVIHRTRRQFFSLLVVESTHFGAAQVLGFLGSEVRLDVIADDPLIANVDAVLDLALIR